MRNVTVLPPTSGDLAVDSDEELVPTSEKDPPAEVAGEVELDISGSDSSDDECSNQSNIRWRKSTQFSVPLEAATLPDNISNFEELCNLSQFDLWRKFFSEDMVDMIKEQTELYAKRDKMNPNFTLTRTEIMHFVGILLLSGYNTLPEINDYWSNLEDLGVPLGSRSMSWNRFQDIKKYVHVADNNNLQPGNKVAKVSPLYDLLNKNLQRFGIFKSTLSIDELMCPYYGKHSCKMFIRMKPIRFGFKLWVLAGITWQHIHCNLVITFIYGPILYSVNIEWILL